MIMMTRRSLLLLAFCWVCLTSTPFHAAAFDEDIIDDYTLGFSHTNLRKELHKNPQEQKRALKENGGKKTGVAWNIVV